MDADVMDRSRQFDGPGSYAALRTDNQVPMNYYGFEWETTETVKDARGLSNQWKVWRSVQFWLPEAPPPLRLPRWRKSPSQRASESVSVERETCSRLQWKSVTFPDLQKTPPHGIILPVGRLIGAWEVGGDTYLGRRRTKRSLPPREFPSDVAARHQGPDRMLCQAHYQPDEHRASA